MGEQPSDSLNRQQIDEIVGAIKESRRFSRRTADDRWTFALSLVIAAIPLIASFWFGWYRPSGLSPIRSAMAPVGGMVLAVGPLIMIWYLDHYWRAVGWILLVGLGWVLPLIALVIMHYA